MGTEETGQITGTKDKDYNVIWFTEQCLSNVLRLETYVRTRSAPATPTSPSSSAARRRRAARELSRASSCSPADWRVTAPNLTALRRSARDCRRCELYESATQTVFGKGPAAAEHFKWRERGKRRLHDTPRAPELNACRPWLESELAPIAAVTIHPSAVLRIRPRGAPRRPRRSGRRPRTGPLRTAAGAGRPLRRGARHRGP